MRPLTEYARATPERQAEMLRDGHNRRRVRWVSGAASAVAAMLDWRKHPVGVFATCETRAEHEDNERFLKDIETWLGQPIIRLHSDEYEDTWDVWERKKFIAGIDGAPCTSALKMLPRHAFQMVDDIHIFGYDNGRNDRARAARFVEHFFELTIETPLIDAGLDKAACLALLQGAGIAPPLTYALGFEHANCLPCGKATSPNYWALVRLHFPEVFWRMAELSRRLGARLTRINDVRIFIDEIPADWPVSDAYAPACDFLCHLASQDLKTGGAA